MLKQGRSFQAISGNSRTSYNGKESAIGLSGSSLAAVAQADPRLAALYPFTISMYSAPPQDELTLYEFETYALDRLRVLRAIESSRLRSKGLGDDIAAIKLLEPVIAKHLDMKRNTLIKAVGSSVLYEQRRKDHISHYILRMAYSRTEDLRQWLIKQEVALFKYRLGVEQQVDRDAFIQLSQLDFTAVTFEDMCLLRMEMAASSSKSGSGGAHSGNNGSLSKQETVQRLLADLRATYTGPHNAAMQTQLMDADSARALVFYRVPFEQVCELVGRRSVLLMHGMAYVPEHERSVLVVHAFRDALAAGLLATAKALPRLDEDDRLVPVLNSLARQYLDKDYSTTSRAAGSLHHEEVDRLVGHFPPCMQQLQHSLRLNAHLKHQGRLQLGLFLKGAGLSLDEALIFWRKAFHRMTDDEFAKKGYLYNVRYNYGLEAFSQDHLATMMGRMHVADAGATEVLSIAHNGHYQIACTRLFELTRGKVHAAANASVKAGGVDMGTLIEPIEHPNQWFDLSMKGSAASAQQDGKRGDAMAITPSSATIASN
ncbi:hypothetical protein BSLG_009857 [Batrachochytrium salamandrivorans]|nr:hypothetical protein BSLG_009857 [Batrachochytrium salamandrivorans]